jgi:hypothetical protein
VRVATLNNGNEGIFASGRSLPLNATTNVRVEAFENEIFLFLNNSFDTMASLSADRIFGAATLFAPNPWSTAALATIGSIQMNEAFKTLYIASSAFNGPLSKSAVQENSYVPPNFALSFDIKPSKKVSSMASIIHFVGSESVDLGLFGRMPGMIFTNVTD